MGSELCASLHRKICCLAVPCSLRLNFMHMEFSEWLNVNLLQDANSGVISNEWKLLFMTAIWRLWTRRCRFVFQPDETDLSSSGLVESILGLAKEMRTAYGLEGRKVVKERLVSWQPPPPSVVKINTDGAARGNPGIAGAGDIFRDETGAWLLGFQAHLGCVL